ncbi:MAG: NHL repeat-containing protein [Thermoleophilia bacterium]
MTDPPGADARPRVRDSIGAQRRAGRGAGVPPEKRPDRRRFNLRLLLGGGLLIVGLIGVVVYAASLENRGSKGPVVVQLEQLKQDLFQLEAAVLVRTAGEQGYVETFRPQSGTPFGDDVVFVDALAGSLLVLDASGLVREVILEDPRGEGVAEPQFTAVAASSTGTLLLADLVNGQIWNYGIDGRFLGAFLGVSERTAAGLGRPTALAVDDLGQTYVADVGDQTVKVFNKAGGLVRTLGAEGFTSGRLDHPTGVAVDDFGYVYVADSNNRRVQVFDPQGRLVRTIADTGGAGLLLPRSVALDPSGRLHVVDAFAERVWVFEVDGDYLGSYGARGPADERLSLPEGVAVLGGKVVVGDRGNGRLMVYAE